MNWLNIRMGTLVNLDRIYKLEVLRTGKQEWKIVGYVAHGIQVEISTYDVYEDAIQALWLIGSDEEEE